MLIVKNSANLQMALLQCVAVDSCKKGCFNGGVFVILKVEITQEVWELVLVFCNNTILKKKQCGLSVNMIV